MLSYLLACGSNAEEFFTFSENVNASALWDFMGERKHVAQLRTLHQCLLMSGAYQRDEDERNDYIPSFIQSFIGRSPEAMRLVQPFLDPKPDKTHIIWRFHSFGRWWDGMDPDMCSYLLWEDGKICEDDAREFGKATRARLHDVAGSYSVLRADPQGLRLVRKVWRAFIRGVIESSIDKGGPLSRLSQSGERLSLRFVDLVHRRRRRCLW